MDRTAVTKDEFAAFVAATGYLTVAERRPDASPFAFNAKIDTVKVGLQ